MITDIAISADTQGIQGRIGQMFYPHRMTYEQFIHYIKSWDKPYTATNKEHIKGKYFLKFKQAPIIALPYHTMEIKAGRVVTESELLRAYCDTYGRVEDDRLILTDPIVTNRGVITDVGMDAVAGRINKAYPSSLRETQVLLYMGKEFGTAMYAWDWDKDGIDVVTWCRNFHALRTYAEGNGKDYADKKTEYHGKDLYKWDTIQDLTADIWTRDNIREVNGIRLYSEAYLRKICDNIWNYDYPQQAEESA